MLLSPAKFEALSLLMKEHDHPQTRLGMWAECIANQVSGDIWARRVDTALVGGDPLTLCLALQRASKQAGPQGMSRLLIAHQGSFPGAPLAALEDPQFVQEAVDDGTIPSHLVPGVGTPAERAVGILERAQVSALASLRTWSAVPYFTSDPLQATKMHVEGDFILRVTRPRDVARTSAWNKTIDNTGPEFPQPPQGAGGRFHSASRSVFDRSFSRFRTELRGMCRAPPPGQRYADAFFATHVAVLSGVVSVGAEDARDEEKSERMRALGMNVFRMAQGVPISVADAVIAWRADLKRAARGSWMKTP